MLCRDDAFEGEAPPDKGHFVAGRHFGPVLVDEDQTRRFPQTVRRRPSGSGDIGYFES